MAWSVLRMFSEPQSLDRFNLFSLFRDLQRARFWLLFGHEIDTYDCIAIATPKKFDFN